MRAIEVNAMVKTVNHSTEGLPDAVERRQAEAQRLNALGLRNQLPNGLSHAWHFVVVNGWLMVQPGRG